MYDISRNRYTAAEANNRFYGRLMSAKPETNQGGQFCHPRYWPNWLVIGTFRLIGSLSFDWQLKIGSGIGRIAHAIAKNRRHIAATNISLCFPDKTPPQQKQMVRDIFINNGRGIMETHFAWTGSLEAINSRFHFEGLEHLEKAAANGTGVLLIGMHFSTLDLCGAMLSQKIPFHVMYRRNKNPLVEQVMGNGRRRNFPAAIERADIKAVIRALKNQQIVWYGPDQDYGRKQSLFAPFFNIQTASIKATMRICQITGAQAVPFSHRRVEGNQYVIELGPALHDFPSGDELKDATRINTIVEDAVLKAPEQYWWVHRRFKTRPPGEKRPY